MMKIFSLVGLLLVATGCGVQNNTSSIHQGDERAVNLEKFLGKYLVQRELDKFEALNLGYAMIISKDVKDDDLNGSEKLREKNKDAGTLIKIISMTSRRVEVVNGSEGPSSGTNIFYLPKKGKDYVFEEDDVNGWKWDQYSRSEVGVNTISFSTKVTLEKGNAKSAMIYNQTIKLMNDDEISAMAKIEFVGDFKNHYLSVEVGNPDAPNLIEGTWSAKYKRVKELPEDLSASSF